MRLKTTIGSRRLAICQSHAAVQPTSSQVFRHDTIPAARRAVRAMHAIAIAARDVQIVHPALVAHGATEHGLGSTKAFRPRLSCRMNHAMCRRCRSNRLRTTSVSRCSVQLPVMAAKYVEPTKPSGFKPHMRADTRESMISVTASQDTVLGWYEPD